jgi:hypothetical protein
MKKYKNVEQITTWYQKNIYKYIRYIKCISNKLYT